MLKILLYGVAIVLWPLAVVWVLLVLCFFPSDGAREISL